MGTTTRRKMAHRRLGGRLRPGLEHLETRQVLSASLLGSTLGLPSVHSPVISVSPTANSSLSIVSTTPANLASLVSSPSTISITFDRPLDDFLVSNNDFVLVHVASDGSTSPLLPGEAKLGESLDPNGRRIDLAVSDPLTAGRYRLLLNPEGQLRGLDGSTIANTSSGLVLSDFSFNPPQAGLASAVNLQALGPLETVVPGLLDLSTNPGAVQYDKFELAPGHHWLVGLEISSHRDGGTLDSSLSLFDAQGHLIAASNEGLANDPGDPYLFQGLDPGTYYVGIASARNLPSASGVYDPAASGIDSGNSGGPFQLHLVADPADQSTKVLGLRLDDADSLSTSPTGLTLQFSGALDVASLGASGHQPLTLVDEAGATWTLSPLRYNPSNGQLSLVFDHPLAPGTYTLQLAGQGGLLDLAGRADRRWTARRDARLLHREPRECRRGRPRADPPRPRIVRARDDRLRHARPGHNRAICRHRAGCLYVPRGGARERRPLRDRGWFGQHRGDRAGDLQGHRSRRVSGARSLPGRADDHRVSGHHDLALDHSAA